MKQPVIEFINFSYHYRVQQEPTLKNINLTIYEGEKILIVGPSGSGKSTLASALNGLIPFNAEGNLNGSLKILGKETSQMSIFELSEIVGTVLQDPDGQFIGLTVGEDIAFTLENKCLSQDLMKSQVDQISKLVGISAHLTATPHSLSGGQKQRTTLAGVMVEDADILLFDEPLASLDPATGKSAMQLIDRLANETKKTIIIVEHRLEDVLQYPIDRIIVMDAGQIIADLPPAELFNTDILYTVGIREPLYISALKALSPIVQEKLQLDVLDKLDVTPYRHGLQSFITENHATLSSTSTSVQPELSIKETLNETPVLEFKNIHFGYEVHQPLLQDINLKVYPGEMISLVGKNGAGKSTLTKLISGFYQPTSGHILLKGKDISSFSISQRSRSIGMVMQNPNQMISKPMLYDEVALALRLQGLDETFIKERVYETLKVCGLYPMRNWPISALSYGQKKRATIAAILVTNPEILILDEPTAGQDFRHYTELMQFLKQLNQQGITIIMITHDMHLMLEYTNRCIVLSNNHILADSHPIKVLINPELILQAHLKETSLHTLATSAGIDDPETLIRSFINYDRRREPLCLQPS